MFLNVEVMGRWIGGGGVMKLSGWKLCAKGWAGNDVVVGIGLVSSQIGGDDESNEAEFDDKVVGV